MPDVVFQGFLAEPDAHIKLSWFNRRRVDAGSRGSLGFAIPVDFFAAMDSDYLTFWRRRRGDVKAERVGELPLSEIEDAQPVQVSALPAIRIRRRGQPAPVTILLGIDGITPDCAERGRQALLDQLAD